MQVQGSQPRGRPLLVALLLVVALPAAVVVLPDGFRSTLPDPVSPLTAAGSAPRISLQIRLPEFMILSSLRDRSLERGMHFRSENDMFPAVIASAGRREKVRIRLKGDRLDHLRSSKWSWRVHVTGGGQVRGMRRFSLQAPETRGHHFEAEFFHHLRGEGLLAPRYEFVELLLNETRVGIMALEEHFSTELLESQGRREGVIVRLDEADYWRNRQRFSREIVGWPNRDLGWRLARVNTFRETAVARSPLLTRQARLAAGLFRGLQAERLTPSEVFDVDELGRFFALYDFWGYWHGLRWHNVRFYLNPFTLKLEPIAFDSTSWVDPELGSLFRHPQLMLARSLLGDAAVYAAYREHLSRFLEPEFRRQAVAGIAPLEQTLVLQLGDEYRRLRQHRASPDATVDVGQRIEARMRAFEASAEAIPGRQEVLDGMFTGREQVGTESEEPFVGVVYADRIETEDGRVELELATNLKQDVRVTALFRDGRPLSEIAEVRLPIRLEANYFDHAPHVVRVPLPAGAERTAEITGEASVASDPDRVYRFTARDYVPVLDRPPLPEVGSLSDLLRRHPYLEWDGQSLVLPAGSWPVREPLILPRILVDERSRTRIPHPGLRIEPGAELRFSREAYLLTFGPLLAQGSVARPISFSADDGASWKGLVVLGSPERSRLQHVRVRDTSETRAGPWQLTGGVTFYEADVSMSDVRLSASHAEDALNIVRSDFLLERVEISETDSDGLDSDFSSGRILDSAFRQIRGDAIDLSGSRVWIEGLTIEKVRDKGLSVGEKSTLDGRRLTVVQAGAAVVSKDASHVELYEIDLRSIEFAGLMSYEKKPEYGPAELRASGVRFDESSKLALAQRGSKIFLDGKAVKAMDLDVDALYAFGFMSR